MERLIMRYDMNYYYAQVEIRDNPTLSNKIVIVGGFPSERGGIVAAVNYPGRELGIYAGMPSFKAKEIARNAVFIYPNMNKYWEIAQEIQNIAREYSDNIEFIALDEAYIEMTYTYKLFNNGNIQRTALELQKKILDKTGLTCSMGIGYNKISSKVASGMIKPSGYYRIKDQKEFTLMVSDFPVGKLYGVGDSTEQELKRHNIYKIRDIQNYGIDRMKKLFGIRGEFLFLLSMGIDERAIVSSFEEKGIGNSITLRKDAESYKEVVEEFFSIIQSVAYRLQNHKKHARCVSVWLRYSDFIYKNKSKRYQYTLSSVKEIYKAVRELLQGFSQYNGVRAVGIRLSHLTAHKFQQLTLDQNNYTGKIDKLNKIESIKFDLRKQYKYKTINDTFLTEYSKLIGEKNDSRKFNEITDVRPVEYIKKLYK